MNFKKVFSITLIVLLIVAIMFFSLLELDKNKEPSEKEVLEKFSKNNELFKIPRTGKPEITKLEKNTLEQRKKQNNSLYNAISENSFEIKYTDYLAFYDYKKDKLLAQYKIENIYLAVSQ